MFKHDDKKLESYFDCYMEKMRDFGFSQYESVVLLLNAGEKLTADKLLEVVDYLEPSGGVREDVDKDTARKEIERILNE